MFPYHMWRKGTVKMEWRFLEEGVKVIREWNAAYMFQNICLFESKHAYLIFRISVTGFGDEPLQILHQHSFGDAAQTESSRRSYAGSTAALLRLSS